MGFREYLIVVVALLVVCKLSSRLVFPGIFVAKQSISERVLTTITPPSHRMCDMITHAEEDGIFVVSRFNNDDASPQSKTCQLFRVDEIARHKKSTRYTIQYGDTLDGIARCIGVTEHELKVTNGIIGWTPPVGTTITLPSALELQLSISSVWKTSLLGLSMNSLESHHHCIPPAVTGSRSAYCWMPVHELPECTTHTPVFSRISANGMLLKVDTSVCPNASWFSGMSMKDAVKKRKQVGLWRAPSFYGTVVKGTPYKDETPVLFDDTGVILVRCDDTNQWNLHIALIPITLQPSPIAYSHQIPKPPSILMLMVDTISRAHFVRNFPLTSALLEELHFGGKYTLTQQLLHNVIARGTAPNYGGLLSGQPTNHHIHVSDHDSWLWNVLKRDRGYVTAAASDGNARELLLPWRQDVDNIDYTLFDVLASRSYTNNVFACGDWGRLCAGQKDAHVHMLEYMFQVQMEHRDRPALMMMHLSAGHEATMRASRSYDRDFYSHILRLQRANLLEETVVLIVGDHGTQTGRFYATRMGSTEYKMPAAFMLTPRNAFSKKSETTLHLNQKRLTTAYDLHRTLWHMALYPELPPHPTEKHTNDLSHKLFETSDNSFLGGLTVHNANFQLRKPTRYPYSASLLNTLLPTNRSCADALIPRWWCHCGVNVTIVAHDDPGMQRAVAHAIHHINERSQNKDLCATVALDRVKHAEASVSVIQRPDGTGIRKDGDKERIVETTYLIDFYTKPNALWQARGTSTIVGSVIRISTYNTDPCDKKEEDPQFCMCPKE